MFPTDGSRSHSCCTALAKMVHKIAKFMKKPTSAPTSARFRASGNFMQQDAPDVLSIFCGELHLPLLWCAGTDASMQNQQTDQESRFCCWLSAGFPGGGGRGC